MIAKFCNNWNSSFFLLEKLQKIELFFTPPPRLFEDIMSMKVQLFSVFCCHTGPLAALYEGTRGIIFSYWLKNVGLFLNHSKKLLKQCGRISIYQNTSKLYLWNHTYGPAKSYPQSPTWWKMRKWYMHFVLWDLINNFHRLINLISWVVIKKNQVGGANY